MIRPDMNRPSEHDNQTAPTDPADHPPAPDQTSRISLRVRYAEVDAMGALHHSRYWVYFEMGRTELLRNQGIRYRDLESAGVFFVVAQCAARFRAPARYDDWLTLTTRVAKTGAARIDHSYELRRDADNTLIATAETTLACVDKTGRIIPIPEQIPRQ
jgi:acyl-CoA thioester hydrolase